MDSPIKGECLTLLHFTFLSYKKYISHHLFYNNLVIKKQLSSASIKAWGTKNKKININKFSSCSKEIVPFGIYLSSSVGIRFNQINRNNTFLFSTIREQIIGHLLGDGSVAYLKTSVNPRFHLGQTLSRFQYL
jgi:hypothetical protein